MWIVRLALRRAYTFVVAAVLVQAIARAGVPNLTVVHQPMVSTGLAAGYPFEAWFCLDKSSDPAVPGYEVPAGATIRFTFPEDFPPRIGASPEAVMLHGWPQGAIPVTFTIQLDDRDPRTVVIHFDQAILPQPPERPGLKAVHLRANVTNPKKGGDYALRVQFQEAGTLSGTTTALAHITDRPEPNVAAFNQLHEGGNEDWQRVTVGMDAPLPIDFLVTLPEESRSVISLKPAAGGGLRILSDGRPIGSITTQGVPVILESRSLGPGFSRLGIIELRAHAGSTAGIARIVASLEGGTRYVIHLVVERP
jgi:hypothetical protein